MYGTKRALLRGPQNLNCIPYRAKSPKSPDVSWKARGLLRYVVTHVKPNDLFRLWAITTVAFFAQTIDVSGASNNPPAQGVAKVTRMTGTVKWSGAETEAHDKFDIGDSLKVGDKLETTSLDASVELVAFDGATVTLAGNSTLNFQSSEDKERQLSLRQGSLLFASPDGETGNTYQIESPSATLLGSDARFNLHVTSTETTIRVNRGRVRVLRSPDEYESVVDANHQAVVSINSTGPVKVIRQPVATDHWKADFDSRLVPMIGCLVSANAGKPATLAAGPLFWPVENAKPDMLYVAAIPVWKANDQPVVIRPDSSVYMKGKTRENQKVRIGFSLQRAQGVFAGQFETEVSIDELNQSSELISDMDYVSTFRNIAKQDGEWEVVLPVGEFRPLYSAFADSVDGLEVSNIYALTVGMDAGLELTQVEILPPVAIPEFVAPQ